VSQPTFTQVDDVERERSETLEDHEIRTRAATSSSAPSLSAPVRAATDTGDSGDPGDAGDTGDPTDDTGDSGDDSGDAGDAGDS
jgi:hypothetical protein